MTRLQIVGGGRMGEALLAGLVTSGWARPEDLAVVEPLADRRRTLVVAHPGVDVRDSPAEAPAAVLAVKPADVPAAARSLSGRGVQRVLSIAAGVPTVIVEGELAGVAVVRAMPNTPALVGAGASAVAPGASAGPADVAWAEEVLAAVGTVVRVDEADLDAVTGLSGSGPAYVFLVAESLVDAGILAGLTRPVAEILAYQTIAGAAALLAETGATPAELRAQVTSPGGTTAAGLRVLEAAGVRAAFLDAVLAATRRAAELGSEPGPPGR